MSKTFALLIGATLMAFLFGTFSVSKLVAVWAIFLVFFVLKLLGGSD